MSNNFTPRAQQALALAKKEAEKLNHNYIGTEHLLIGLINLGQGLAIKVLQEIGVGVEDVYEAIEDSIEPGSSDKSLDGKIPMTPSCLLYTSPSPRDRQKSRMPSSA